MNSKGFMAVLVLTASLTGCNQIRNQDAGTVVGGALGGILGSQVGKGSGRVAATIGGTLIGGFIGNRIGRSMDDVDKLKTSRALESAPTGESVAWRNPDNGNDYRVTPTETHYAEQQPCRDYTVDAVIDGRPQVVHGTACRQPNGTWRA